MGKKLICVHVLFLLIMTCCTSPRVVTDHHEDYEHQTEIKTDSFSHTLHDILKTSSISRIDTSIFNFVLEFDIFDTDKGKDENGDYPVLMSGVLKGEQLSSSQSTTIDTLQQNIETYVSETETDDEKTKWQENEHAKEKRSVYDYLTLSFFAIGVLLLFAAIIKIFK